MSRPPSGERGPVDPAFLPAGAADSVAAGTVLHATGVATGPEHGERGLLILGPAGSGKTRLALELIALGQALDIALICDDRVQIDAPATPGALPVMSAMPTIAGLVEVRGMGILRHPYRHAAPVWLAVDLGRPSRQAAGGRLASIGRLALAGAGVPCLPGGVGAYAAALLAMLRTGRLPDPEHAPATARLAPTAATGGD